MSFHLRLDSLSRLSRFAAYAGGAHVHSFCTVHVIQYSARWRIPCHTSRPTTSILAFHASPSLGIISPTAGDASWQAWSAPPSVSFSRSRVPHASELVVTRRSHFERLCKLWGTYAGVQASHESSLLEAASKCSYTNSYLGNFYKIKDPGFNVHVRVAVTCIN